MKHIYDLRGMNCNSCVGKVQAALNTVPNVTQVEVTLDPPHATITMDRHVELADLQNAVAHAGEYLIREHQEPSDQNVQTTRQSETQLRTYKPLILVVGYITGISILLSFSTGIFMWSDFFRYFMAGFFLTFSFFKFLDLQGFATSYSSYDLLARRWPSYGYIYAFIELGLGIAYLTALWSVAVYAITIIVMGFSTVGVLQSVLNKRQIQCACLGTVFDLPMSTVTIVEDIAMVLMAGTMLALSVL